MAFNLVDLVKDQVGSAVMNQLGSALGGDSAVTEKAVGGAIPSILQGLMGSASTSSGADSLFKAVQDQDDGILSNIGDLIGGGADSPFASAGGSVLSSLLGGGTLGNLASAVAGFSGMGKSSSNSLLGLLAPVILSVIKRKVLGGGLNASSLASMMMGQKDNIAAAMPAGLSDQLQSSGFLDSIGDTLKGGASTVTDTAGAAVNAVGDTAGAAVNAAGDAVGAVGDVAADTAKAGGSLIGKLLPLIILGALAFFGLKMCSGGQNTTAVERTTTETAAPAVVEQAVVVEQEVIEPIAAEPAAVVADPAAAAAATTSEVMSAGSSTSYTISQATAEGMLESVLTLNADGTGTLTDANGTLDISGASMDANTFSFDIGSMNYSGVIAGDTINGIVSGPTGESAFSGSTN